MNAPEWGSAFVVDDTPPRDYVDPGPDAGDVVVGAIAWTLRLAGLLALFAVGAVIGIAILVALCRFVVWAL
jgi:hypothetical protein